MITISYAITACNEHEELKRLLEQLKSVVRNEDEIIIQLDTNHTEEVLKIASSYINCSYITCELNKDFATFKNNLKNHCKKDYICFIDADEYLSEDLLHFLPQVLENNPVDVFLIPRKNTVDGLTEEHVKKWGWRVENGLINWPDYQMRIVKNASHIKWEGKVHEKITGYKTLSHFPQDVDSWCLIHPKTIERQEKQNNFYNTI